MGGLFSKKISPKRFPFQNMWKFPFIGVLMVSIGLEKTDGIQHLLERYNSMMTLILHRMRTKNISWNFVKLFKIQSLFPKMSRMKMNFFGAGLNHSRHTLRRPLVKSIQSLLSKDINYISNHGWPIQWRGRWWQPIE